MALPSILAICGSTRQRSSNLSLIHAIAQLYQGRLAITVLQGLAELPHFNPDMDTGTPTEAVADFRRQLKKADGVLICTPEYAMGVPGTLKNALDWTVSSMELSNKPVALITASSVGQKGHLSLLETLKVIEADIPESSQLLISFVKTKMNGDKITDIETQIKVKAAINSFIESIDRKFQNP